MTLSMELRRIAALAVFLFVSLGAWAVASPVGSAPDDTYHLPVTWCSWGQSASCDIVGGEDGILVPSQITSICTFQQPLRSASCEFDVTQELVPAPHVQFVGQQNSLSGQTPFHVVIRGLVGDSPTVSVLAMRLVNSLLFTALVAVSLIFLPRKLKFPFAAATVVGIVPVGMFIIASTNPSSWAVSAGAIFWVALVALLGKKSVRTRSAAALLALVLISAVLAVGSRPESAVVLAYSTVAAIIYTFSVWKRDRVRISAIAAGTALLLALALASKVGDRLQFLITLMQGGETGLGVSDNPTRDLVNHVLEIPSFLGALVGLENFSGAPTTGFTRGLGWLDVSLPTSVGLIGVTVVAALIFLGLGTSTRAKWMAWLVVGVGITLSALVPMLSVGFADTFTMQPRYILPGLFALVGFALLPASRKRVRLSAGQAWIVIFAVSIANALALLVFVRRFTNGQSIPFWDLSAIENWWWLESPVSSTTVWAIGAIAFALTAWVALRSWNAEPREREPQTR